MLAAALLTFALAGAPPTFRIDVFHSGSAGEEHFALDRLVLEPLPFPGNPDRPLDDTNLGKYRFEVRERDTHRVLYSRGFDSIYGEWETTSEAKTRWRTFHESLRFPRPERVVEVLVRKRDARNGFAEVWSTVVDPGEPSVDASHPPPAGPVIEILESGPPEQKLDLLVLGDGYTAAQRPKCERDARRLAGALLARSPFRERRSDVNIRAICPASPQRGVSRPSTRLYRASALGTSYDALGSERYLLTFQNRRVREIASQAPYDALVILANSRTYGGGGIFNLYAIVAADNLWAPYILVHELGHALAGLADEYFTSEPVYLPAADRVEPWERNVTALLDPTALKWKALVSPGVPIPTPWQEDEFGARAREFQEKRKQLRQEQRPESELDALFLAQREQETAALATEQYAGEVGAFEGADYEAKGYFRPQLDCIMFSRNPVPFCAVCRGTLDEILDLYARPAPR